MRQLSLVFLAFSAGCGIENELRHTSTLDATTSGVVIAEDGLDAWAAMNGTTCTIDPRWGCPTEDIDLPTDGEEIVDHHQGRTLGRSAVGVHSMTGSAWDAADDLVLADVRVARLWDGGRLAVAGDALTCRLHADGADPVDVSGALCAAGARADVDRRTGSLYVAAEGALYRAGIEGLARLKDTGVDRVARDGLNALTVVGRAGERGLEALDDDGRPVWTASLDGSLTSLAARGERGDLLALVAKDDGFGSLVVLDGATGHVRSSHVLPEGDGELAVSGSGGVIAVIRVDQVHWYAFEVDGEPVAVDPTPPRCMTEWGVSRD